MSRRDDDPIERHDGAHPDGGPPGGSEGPDGDPAPGQPDAGAPTAAPRRSTPLTQQLGRLVIVVLAVLFGIFAMDNVHAVDFSWVVGESRVRSGAAGTVSGGVPLIVLLLVSFAIGALIGVLAEWQFLRGRRRRSGN